MALHIARVEIENFRNFAHLTIDPFPASAVIVGENGVGKSNLLHALRLVLDPTLPDASRRLRPEDFHNGPRGVSMSEGGVVIVKVDFAGYEGDEGALAILADAPVPGDAHRARLTYEFRPRAAHPSVAEGAGDDAQPAGFSPADYEFRIYGGTDETIDARSLRQFIAIKVLPALRDVENDLKSWRRNPLRDILELMPPLDENLDKAAAALAQAMTNLSGDPNIDLLERHLANRLNLMIGAKNDVVPSVGFASAAAEDLIRFVQLFIDEQRRRTVSDTSLGGANVLYLALLLESLLQQRNAHAFVTTILAVEEPEAHLHVTLQRHLFRHLLATETTLILTTHSPHIAAVAPLTSYVVLRNAGDNGTIGTTTADIELTDAQRRDLERYLDHTRADLLFASYVLLVEGQAETHIVPALAKACGFDLDEYGVVVASVQGTDFAPYVKLLGEAGLSVPYAVLTDGDIDAKQVWAREGGLRRAAKLVPDAVATVLEPRVRSLYDDSLTADDAATLRQELVAEAAEYAIFVGNRTLEVDLAALVPEAIEAAYEELHHPAPGTAQVTAGVRNEQPGGASDPDVRAAFLGRIDEIGKGRFAQRLASHIEQTDIAAAVVASGLRLRDQHLLAALDSVSRHVRGKPLLEAWAPES